MELSNIINQSVTTSSLYYSSPNSIVQQLQNISGSNLVKIIDCPTGNDALNLIMNQSIRQTICGNESFIGISVKFIDQFMFMSDYQLNDMETKYSNIERPILIVLQSCVDRKFLIMWRMKGKRKMLRMEVTENHEEDLNIVEEFVVDFLIKSLKLGEAGIGPIQDPDDVFLDFLKLSHLSDSHDRSLLMVAAEAGNLNVVKYLIKCGLPVRHKLENNFAIDYAYQAGHNEIVYELLQANSYFPKDFNSTQASDDVKIFLDLMNSMHESVEKNDAEKVSQLIVENSHLRYFFNIHNETAIGKALKFVKCDVYEVLMLNHMNYNSGFEYALIIEGLSERDRERIRQINFKHTRKFGEKHIIALMGCSTVVKSKNGPETYELMNYVLNAFNILDNIPRVKKILELTSYYKNLQIVFDFENENLQNLDPTAGAFDTASFYHGSGQIAIAAKKLLNKDTDHIVIGALAHELCHLAMLMTFKNMARPYLKNNIKDRNRYEEILKQCEIKKNEEQIIEWVFGYNKNFHHIELAVRVSHITAHYYKEHQKICENEKTFESLFKNFDEKLTPKIEEKISDLEGKEEKVEKKISLLWKIIIALLIILPIGICLTFLIVYAPTYSWSTLTNEQKIQFKSAIVNFYGVDIKFSKLFASDSEVYNELRSEEIRFGLDGNSSALTEAVNKFYKHKAYLVYSNMTANLQEKFKNLTVDFQGQNVTVKSIFVHYNILRLLNPSHISKIFDSSQLMKISKETKMTNSFFIERFFVNETIDLEKDYYYINGELNERHREVKNMTRVFLEVNDTKIFLLSSPAGEGKSTSFKYYSTKLKEKDPNNWIQYVDLKKHFEAYKKGLEFNLRNFEELLRFLTSNLLNLNELETEIFKEKYRLNKTCFLWDGIDEISPIYKDFMLRLTSTIKDSSNCSQFISTRPQFSKDFSIKAHKLMPLGKTTRNEFLLKFFASKKFKVNGEEFWQNYTEHLRLKNESSIFISETVSEAITKAQNILKTIEASENHEKIISNPLLIEMIAEISDTINESLDLNYFQIFDTFIFKKLEIVDDKGDNVKNDTRLAIINSIDIQKTHGVFALYHIFSKNLKNVSILDLHFIAGFEKPSNNLINRYGILQVDNDTDYFNSYTFIHQTFAEFFVARYLGIFFTKFSPAKPKIDSDLNIFLLNSVLFSGKYLFVKKFLLSFAGIEDKERKYFEKFQDVNSLEFQNYFENFLINFSTAASFSSFLHIEAGNKTFLQQSFHQIKNEIENKFLNFFDNRDFLTMESKQYFTPLQYSAFSKDSELLKLVKKKYENFFTHDEIRKIFMKTHEDFLPFFYNVIEKASFETALEVSKYLESLFKYQKLELREILSHREAENDSIFGWFECSPKHKEKLNNFVELLRKTFENNEEKLFKDTLEKLKVIYLTDTKEPEKRPVNRRICEPIYAFDFVPKKPKCTKNICTKQQGKSNV